MIIRGIHHIGLNSLDAARLVAFYKRVFDLEQVADFAGWRDYPLADRLVGGSSTAASFAMVRGPNCYIEIFQFDAPEGTNPAPLKAWDHGFTHLCFGVADVVAAHAELRARGMEFLSDQPIDFGEIRAIYGRDVDGNLIELIETDAEHAFAFDRLGTVVGPS